jgi:hypothetical protein
MPPFRRTWSGIALAVVIRHLVDVLVSKIINTIVSATNNSPSSNIYTYAFGKMAVISVTQVLYVLLQMPAEVIFIRVAASMLPSDDEVIIPFDRSFGGRVTPEAVGGSGKIGNLDAWRSFHRDSRARFIKAVGWSFGIQIAWLFVFVFVCILQGLIL